MVQANIGATNSNTDRSLLLNKKCLSSYLLFPFRESRRTFYFHYRPNGAAIFVDRSTAPNVIGRDCSADDTFNDISAQKVCSAFCLKISVVLVVVFQPRCINFNREDVDFAYSCR